MRRRNALKQIVTLAIVLAVAVASYLGRETAPRTTAPPTERSSPREVDVERTRSPLDDSSLRNAIAQRQRDVLVQGRGEVIKLLPDDHEGSRHQRILLRLPMGGTLLVAHNIDLAPRVAGLERGDTIEFQGEYVWNDKGGVLHWTHHDPARRHPGGWLRHEGRSYE
jgi:Protein of unknown function (DUF3465)